MDYASIRPTFEKVAVNKALLIDDAFDPALIEEDDLMKGFELVETKDDVEAAFREAGGAWPTDFAAFSQSVTTDEPLKTVLMAGLEKGRKEPAFKLANAIFGQSRKAVAAKRAPLDALSAVLRELGIEPAELGSKQEVDDRKYPLIFLDYYLGEEAAPSIERSVAKIKSVIADYTDDEMPIVVLMSSQPPGDEAVDKFRKNAELLGCQFLFVKKEKFTAAAFELVSTLADRAASLPQARVMSRYIKAWKGSLERAIAAVSEDIATLDLQDFYFIWRKAGDGKNRRFGEHISNLFEGLLRRRIESGDMLEEATDALSALSFDKIPPNTLIPSPIVARLAHASAFKDLKPFPDDYASPPNPLGIDLGELFISDSRVGTPRRRKLEARMVISQACDLEHGKVGTVLMIEGEVMERTATTRTSSNEAHRRLRVDIFQFQNDKGDLEDLIIEWDAQRMLAIKVKTFHDEMRTGKFERVGRLRPLHALAMQQKFASQLTRVGMPDSLPVYRYGALEVRVAAKAGGATTKVLLTTSNARRTVCIEGEEQKHFLILAEELEGVRTALGKADPADYADGVIIKLREELNDISKFQQLLQVQLEKGKKKVGAIEFRDADEAVPDNHRMANHTVALFSFVA